MSKPQAQTHFADALKHPGIVYFIASVGFFTLASRALTVVIGFQVYHITKSLWALGMLGLIEAIPALALVPIGGHAADHFNRRTILILTRASSCICALALLFLSLQGVHTSVWALYAVVFAAGIARGFADPANSAFEAQVVPKHLTVNASSWIGSIWVSCSIAGPAAIGFIFDAHGAVGAYICIAIAFLISWWCTGIIKPRPQAKPAEKEPMLKSIALGWRYVWNNQPLFAAMALDLFAVFFGGVIALLPVFATDILKTGAWGLGLLNAAPAAGSLIIMLISTKYAGRLIERAGFNLLWCVAGFGLSILIFAFSKNFILSLAALALSGIFDGISMVIRRSMVRLLSPDDMRGRISAVSWTFVCASNELGAFESGVLAALIGTVPCVAVGGVITLLVVGGAAIWAPKLRRLSFDPVTLQPRGAPI